MPDVPENMRPKIMLRAFTVVLVLAMVSLWGCASSAPPPRPSARPFDDLRRVVVVVSGESTFAIVDFPVEPGRTFDEVLKWIPWLPTSWIPFRAALGPTAKLVHNGINWALGADRAATAAPSVAGLSPRSVVAGAMARTLEASGWFDEVRALEREPTGEDRRRADAIVRVSVPNWGLVRVSEDGPGLLSSFADVRGQMAVRGTGVIVWEDRQDVTNPEQLPADTFVRDRALARQEMTDVLERAGQRLANELLYARGTGPNGAGPRGAAPVVPTNDPATDRPHRDCAGSSGRERLRHELRAGCPLSGGGRETRPACVCATTEY